MAVAVAIAAKAILFCQQPECFYLSLFERAYQSYLVY